MDTQKLKFLDCFPDHVYRYIDQTGSGRPPVSSRERRDDLNIAGYESYFTVNGFKGAPNAKKENCSSINSFFVDIDGRKDLEELENIKKKLDPTFIIETGRGFHIYWVLDNTIYKDKVNNWEETVLRWEKIGQSIVSELKADPVVKDITRILRVPNTFYWKKTGDKYTTGTDGVLVIKGIYKNLKNKYSLDEIEKVFPIKEEIITTEYPVNIDGDKLKKYADNEKKNFFDRVNEKFPIEERDSFQLLISGAKETIPNGYPSRNQALLITASLMRQAGWDKKRALEHIKKVGWHGIESEQGGMAEISNTINSAYSSGYTYSYKNDLISYNMTPAEQLRIQDAYTAVSKARKETDKIRFSNYEREIQARYPNLKKNEIGMIFNYENGVYKLVSDQEMSSMILNGLYDDMLWNFRTNKNVADKLSCLIGIIPDFKITEDKGHIINVKNGLLDTISRVLMPHSPNFVSLIQYDVTYDPNTTCPIWLECITDWMEGPESQEKSILLQQFSGYCLTSSMHYDKALFMVGDGGNGKSTFIDTIGMVLGGEAVSHIDLEGLEGQYGMKGIIGKRLNIVEEVHGNYYQSNKIKKLISGEEVTIDIKYKDQFTFRPECKFVLSVNKLPRVDDNSYAMERRICAVDFRKNYRENPNISLRTRQGLLYKELSGILNWMLDGLDMLIRDKKFIVTAEQTQMMKDYRGENSSVEGFIIECLTFNLTVSTSARLLYDEYKKYCISDGRKFKANIVFTKEMIAYGKRYGGFTYQERENGRDQTCFYGVALSDSWKKASGGLLNHLDYGKK